MKASDLREKSVDDLKELQGSLAGDVFQNRLKNFTNRLDDTSSIRKTKRELARVTTLLREVELGIERGPRAPGEGAVPAAGTEAKAADEPKKKAAAPKKAAKPAGTKTKSAQKSEAKES
jgi:large subunit ribosomal protein L29